MGADTRAMTVHILGHEYKIRSTESGEFVRDVALYVDELMHQISSRMSAGTQTQVAVLAALNIAEELFRERRGDVRMPEHDPAEVDERLSALVCRVDEIIRHASENGSDVPSPSRSHTG
jgi:cell division protein ZapA